MVNRNTSSVQSNSKARKGNPIGDDAHSSIENCSTIAVVAGAKPARKQAKSGPVNVKIRHQESPSEEAFGLKRLSFLLPDELAKEFDERGGAAWLALVLRDASAGGDEPQTGPIAAAVPVVSSSAKSVEPLPAQKPDDQVHCGRRRAGMR